MKYPVFMSHTWTYSKTREAFMELLSKTDIELQECVVPKKDRIRFRSDNDKLEEVMREKIESSVCCVFIAGVYDTYKKWIDKEVAISKELGKPIIVMEKYSESKTSKFLQESADEVIGWDPQMFSETFNKLVLKKTEDI